MGDGGVPTHGKNPVDTHPWYDPWRNEPVAWSLYNEKTKINGDYLLSLQTKRKIACSTSQKRIGIAVLRRSIPNLQRLWMGQ